MSKGDATPLIVAGAGVLGLTAWLLLREPGEDVEPDVEPGNGDGDGNGNGGEPGDFFPAYTELARVTFAVPVRDLQAGDFFPAYVELASVRFVITVI